MPELLFIIALALMNAIGGRGKDVGMKRWSRFAFRFLLPVAATFAYAGFSQFTPYETLMSTLGVAVAFGLWFPWGWSFDQITGVYDKKKYPKWLQAIGLWAYPLDSFKATNRKRGIITMGIRGLYGYPGFVLLAYLNPLSLLYGLVWGAQGAIYWAVGRQVGGRTEVLVAEIVDGAVKAAAIMGVFYVG